MLCLSTTPGQWGRLRVAHLAAVLSLAWVMSGCSEERGAPADDGVDRVSEITDSLRRKPAIGASDVLLLYRECDKRAARSDDWIAAMAFFPMKIEEIGPKAVPALIAAFASQHVGETHILHAILSIDRRFGTTHYAEMLVGNDVDEEKRARAVDSASGIPELVAQLEAILHDAGRSEEQRARAERAIRRSLDLCARSPNLPMDRRNWAKEKLKQLGPSPEPYLAPDRTRPRMKQ